MNQFTRQCEWCMEQFKTPYKDKLYCKKLCSQRARDLRKRIRSGKQRPIFKRICKGCAENFVTRNKQQLFCNNECRNWMRQQMREKRAKEVVSLKTDKFKAKLYWQANGRCGICKQHIDITLKYPDPQSFSIDHIIPVSLGGNHAVSNLQPAHLVCNSKRGNKPIQ